jgi:hypothetical protein
MKAPIFSIAVLLTIASPAFAAQLFPACAAREADIQMQLTHVQRPLTRSPADSVLIAT